jgi:riboflavin synthase
MFTGLIETTGRIEAFAAHPSGRRLRVATSLGAELQPGDSIAVNGVCLTAISADATGFEADVSPATLAVTTFADQTVGRLVNLERPLRADARLGGHFVLGHVDAAGAILRLEAEGDCYWLDIGAPDAVAPLLISKGSVAVDGISLTIAQLAAGRVTIQIVPFTFAHTTMSEARAGDRVNLEADVLGKYVARLLELRRETGERVSFPL